MLVEVHTLEDGRIQLTVLADDEAERSSLQHFVEALEGRPVRRCHDVERSLRPLRLVRVGFTGDDERVCSLRFETPT